MPTIRLTTPEDIPVLLDLFEAGKVVMAQIGNPNQWLKNYPGKERLLNDIAQEASYVIEENDAIIGSFALIIGKDATYKKIYNGAWPNNKPYGTIHRLIIAPDAQKRGLARWVIKASESILKSQGIDQLRIDTHPKNAPMIRLIESAGFTHCGEIVTENGSGRMAFAKLL